MEFHGMDDDQQALEVFEKLRAATQIDYKRVQDDDVLADAMQAANSTGEKKILMRYRRLK
jgi:hypothetical protein